MRGFTLVETMVAITILIVGVVGPLTIAVRGITDGMFARNQITANYLAQEALEVILNRRLSNSASGNPEVWDGFPQGCLNGSSVCTVDARYQADQEPIQDVGSNCDNDECSLVFDKDSGYFRKPSAAPSPAGPVFIRKIQMMPIGMGNDPEHPNWPDEVRVKVEVIWMNLGMQRNLIVTENLYRYYP